MLIEESLCQDFFTYHKPKGPAGKVRELVSQGIHAYLLDTYATSLSEELIDYMCQKKYPLTTVPLRFVMWNYHLYGGLNIIWVSQFGTEEIIYHMHPEELPRELMHYEDVVNQLKQEIDRRCR